MLGGVIEWWNGGMDTVLFAFLDLWGMESEK